MTRSQLPVRLSPCPLRALSARVRASEFVRDVYRHGFLPIGYALILVAALIVGLVTGDSYLTPDGSWQPIPTEMPGGAAATTVAPTRASETPTSFTRCTTEIPRATFFT